MLRLRAYHWRVDLPKQPTLLPNLSDALLGGGWHGGLFFCYHLRREFFCPCYANEANRQG
jgi:hypothetical protein